MYQYLDEKLYISSYLRRDTIFQIETFFLNFYIQIFERKEFLRENSRQLKEPKKLNGSDDTIIVKETGKKKHTHKNKNNSQEWISFKMDFYCSSVRESIYIALLISVGENCFSHEFSSFVLCERWIETSDVYYPIFGPLRDNKIEVEWVYYKKTLEQIINWRIIHGESSLSSFKLLVAFVHLIDESIKNVDESKSMKTKIQFRINCIFILKVENQLKQKPCLSKFPSILVQMKIGNRQFSLIFFYQQGRRVA